MVKVEICTTEFNDQLGRFEAVKRAEIAVDGRKVWIQGEASYIGLDIPVLDPKSGRRLTFHGEPEAWARALPGAYRAGDIVARVVFDQDIDGPVGI